MTDFEETVRSVEVLKLKLKEIAREEVKIQIPKRSIFKDINFKMEYIDELEAQADELNISVQEFIELAVDFYKKHK